MNLQLVVRPGLPPGRALLRFGPAAPGPVSLRIGKLPRPGEAALYLNPRLEEAEVWQPKPHDIALPAEWPVSAVDGGLEVEVGAEVLWYLRPGHQYEACATAAGSAPVAGRLTFPKGLVLRGERPTGWQMAAPAEAAPRTPVEDPVAITPQPADAMVIPPVAAAVTPPPDPVAVPVSAPAAATAPPQQGGRGKLVLAAGASLLLAGAAAAYVFTGRPSAVPASPAATASAPAAPATLGATAPAAEDRTLAGVRSFLAATPGAEAARQKAEALGTAGQLLDGQFLLHRYAAEKGDMASARALGRFYDPSTWAADKSPLPAPNPVEAARWYQKAAEAGDAESQYRYGMLLRSGRTDDTDGPERSVGWLGKAAAQGHVGAKQALGQ
ncbi:MAG: hypothetical protein L6Q68_08840 [Aquabacterium sp.]|nr:hypothetical protein [Aquabacterium sp.]